jgi:undecaprenyl-diphosphatase
MPKTTFPRLRRFAAARLEPDGEFGLHLTIGVLVLLLAAWIFGGIARDVVEHEALTRLDARLALWLHGHMRPGLTWVMLLLAWLHGIVGTLALALLLGWWLRGRLEPYWLLALAAAVPGGLVLNFALKLAFHRARPHFHDPVLILPTYSFPSGHALSATVVYGFIACYVVRHARTRPVRVATVLLACALVALVAFSRLYLGVHYLSDVLAGIAEGCAWLAVCITAASTLRRRRARRPA